MTDGAHSPYVVKSTGQLFCYADGCGWSGAVSEGEDTNVNSWRDHHKEEA